MFGRQEEQRTSGCCKIHLFDLVWAGKVRALLPVLVAVVVVVVRADRGSSWEGRGDLWEVLRVLLPWQAESNRMQEVLLLVVATEQRK